MALRCSFPPPSARLTFLTLLQRLQKEPQKLRPLTLACPRWRARHPQHHRPGRAEDSCPQAPRCRIPLVYIGHNHRASGHGRSPVRRCGPLAGTDRMAPTWAFYGRGAASGDGSGSEHRPASFLPWPMTAVSPACWMRHGKTRYRGAFSGLAKNLPVHCIYGHRAMEDFPRCKGHSR